LLNIIIPNSLAWLDGHTHQWVDGKYDPQLAGIWDHLRVLTDETDSLIEWRRTRAKPLLQGFVDFRDWLETWPRSILYTWRRWLEHPEQFGEWAAPTVAWPLVRLIGSEQHRLLRDTLTAELVDSWGDRWRHVEHAMLDVLLSEWP
jgi:hypothetical protein